MTTSSESARLHGVDLARGLAFLGMVIVNYWIVLSTMEASLLTTLASTFAGRAAALFVTIAGVGISLMAAGHEARGSYDARTPRTRLLIRAAFLLVVGYSWAEWWRGDILHFYGVYLVVGALLLNAPDRWLWRVVLWVLVAFPFLYLSFGFWDDWNLRMLEYKDFWSWKSLYRNLFYNGWHPVIPWIAFLMVGMWLGRRNLHSPTRRRIVLILAAEIAILAELISHYGTAWYTQHVGGGFFSESSNFKELLGAGSLPPAPLYVVAKGAAAVFIITLCISLMQWRPVRIVAVPFVAVGKMALTLYAAHVVIGIFPFEDDRRSTTAVLIQVGIFCVGSMIFATLWLRFFRRGPLEWVMRKISG